MSYAYTNTARHPSSLHALRSRDAIEWEELPSFADSLTQRLVVLGQRPLGERIDAASPPWVETMAAGLDLLPPSEPFREAFQGLHTREVHEPEVFRLFFGD
ncbi:hypothetical protein [Methylibium sp. Root1272]|jgi:hypothetical protein|uniref:hypothetical protein n=1 Tax=Methylibium sp. Root1272 TaxID=1736441 RepID=UPI0006FBD642|nr:hypothetical protein [Methylibium sp. Root1272]KQW68715.1 hypothetical protein ASC67_08600 [Methylibium sp. Root1272]